MQSSPALSQFLRLLIRLTGARNVLEVGVFTGCSTLAMASAIPLGGKVVAVDNTDRWVTIGKPFWARSGYADRIDLQIGDGDAVLDRLIREGAAGSFDLAFVDANKDTYDVYLERMLVLIRKNGLILFDNILFGGRVLRSHDAETRRETRRPAVLEELYQRYAEGLRKFNQRIMRDERVDIAVLPMFDGVTLARKK
jgi:predicted O-methyltransferase YrrM